MQSLCFSYLSCRNQNTLMSVCKHFFLITDFHLGKAAQMFITVSYCRLSQPHLVSRVFSNSSPSVVFLVQNENNLPCFIRLWFQTSLHTNCLAENSRHSLFFVFRPSRCQVCPFWATVAIWRCNMATICIGRPTPYVDINCLFDCYFWVIIH